MKNLGYIIVGFTVTFLSMSVLTTVMDNKDEICVLNSRVTDLELKKFPVKPVVYKHQGLYCRVEQWVAGTLKQ